MAKTIRKRNSVKTSTVKPLGKPQPGDKTIGIQTAINFHELEDGDKNEEGEESEILITHNKILESSKQNLLNMKSPHIDLFDHRELAGVIAMRILNIGVFDQLETTFPMDV